MFRVVWTSAWLHSEKMWGRKAVPLTDRAAMERNAGKKSLKEKKRLTEKK